MPYTWTPEAEKALLLAAIQEADLKPSKVVWQNVATSLGGGLTAGAVSQKFNKIKNAITSGPPATPSPKKATNTKVNGSGGGSSAVGSKKRTSKTAFFNADNDAAVDDPVIKPEAQDGSKLNMEKEASFGNSNSDTVDDIRSPSKKKVKVEGWEAVGSANGFKDSNAAKSVSAAEEDGDDDVFEIINGYGEKAAPENGVLEKAN